MSNNYTGPLVLTTENDPSLWRTNSYIQRLQARRNAARTRKNRPGITNTIKKWFGAKPAAVATKRRRSRRQAKRERLCRRNTPRIMYE
jgi:hypothetical protein